MSDITTNPPPPSGVIPTEVPLGITGLMSPTLGPVDQPPSNKSMFNLNHGFYLGKFTINNTMANGAQVYAKDFFYPMTESIFAPVSSPGFVNRILVPWDLIPAYYSRMCKVDWELEFVPVKVADSRVSLDLIFNYEDIHFVNNTAQFANDNYHKILDDEDDSLRFNIPQFWLTNNVPTDCLAVTTDTGIHNFNPAYLPKTSLVVNLRNKYQNNPLQPDSFEVVVYMYPKVHSAICIAGKSLVRNHFPDELTFVPIPWFLAKRV